MEWPDTQSWTFYVIFLIFSEKKTREEKRKTVQLVDDSTHNEWYEQVWLAHLRVTIWNFRFGLKAKKADEFHNCISYGYEPVRQGFLIVCFPFVHNFRNWKQNIYPSCDDLTTTGAIW